MPLSTDQLRELLTERSDPARLHPAPEQGLSLRIRRARLRRAAVAGLVAVVAAAGVVTGLHLTQGHPASFAPVSGAQFPDSFTASDGTVYHRIAVASIATGKRSAAITVKAGLYPLDVLGSCDTSGGYVATDIKVNGTYAGLAACPGTPQLIGLSVRPGHEADITFSRTSDNPNTTTWQYGVYEWIPPAVARPAPAVPRLPLSYTGHNSATGQGTTRLSLIASRSGKWPADRIVTITVPDHGRYLDISLACSGAIAGRLQVSILGPGHSTDLMPCSSWMRGQPPGQITFGGQAGVPDTLTFRIQAPSSYWAAAYAKRSASWTIGIYTEGASATQSTSAERAVVLAPSTPFRA